MSENESIILTRDVNVVIIPDGNHDTSRADGAGDAASGTFGGTARA